MLSHEEIWQGLDKLASRHGLSISGLARQAGLDPTSFNRSKRISSDGRPRWPSTESLSKVLACVEADSADMLALLDLSVSDFNPDELLTPPSVPVLGLAQAGAGGFFDSAGYPVGHGFDEVELPQVSEATYALKITGDSMLPLYRAGDVIVVSPIATIRRGDKVVVRTHSGEVMAKILHRITQKKVELESLHPGHPIRTHTREEVDWIARILWATQ